MEHAYWFLSLSLCCTEVLSASGNTLVLPCKLYILFIYLEVVLMKSTLVVTRQRLSMLRHNSRIGTATTNKHCQWFLCLPIKKKWTHSRPCIPTACVCLCCCFWLSWQGKWAGVWEGFILTVTRWSHCCSNCAILWGSLSTTVEL